MLNEFFLVRVNGFKDNNELFKIWTRAQLHNDGNFISSQPGLSILRGRTKACVKQNLNSCFQIATKAMPLSLILIPGYSTRGLAASSASLIRKLTQSSLMFVELKSGSFNMSAKKKKKKKINCHSHSSRKTIHRVRMTWIFSCKRSWTRERIQQGLKSAP